MFNLVWKADCSFTISAGLDWTSGVMGAFLMDQKWVQQYQYKKERGLLLGETEKGQRVFWQWPQNDKLMSAMQFSIQTNTVTTVCQICLVTWCLWDAYKNDSTNFLWWKRKINRKWTDVSRCVTVSLQRERENMQSQILLKKTVLTVADWSFLLQHPKGPKVGDHLS